MSKVLFSRLRGPVGAMAAGLLACGVLTACGSGGSGGGGALSDHYKLRLGSDQTSTNFAIAGDRQFASDVKKLTDGHVTIQLFPGSALGTESATVTGLKQGSIDLGDLCTCNLSGQLPTLGLFDLPYLALSQAQATKLTQSSAMDGVKAALAKQGLVMFGVKPIGPMSLQGKTPIRSVADIKGQKLRTVTSPITTSLFKQLGAVVTPLAPTDVYSALQQGVVNGTTASLPAIIGTKWYQPAKYYSEIQETYLYQLVVGSKQALDRLPQKYQDAVAKAAEESIAYSNEQAPQVISKSIDQLKSLGVTVVPTDISGFIPVGRQIQDQFASKIGTDIVQAARAAVGPGQQ